MRKDNKIGCNDIGFVLLPGGRSYSIAVFVKDSEENNRANSKIIADISRHRLRICNAALKWRQSTFGTNED